MKNQRAVIVILIATAFGLAAVFFATRWIETGPRLSTRQLVVAAVDIPLGTRLTPSMIKVADWPSNSMPEGAIRDLGALDDRVLKASVQRGEPILESKLAPPGTKGGLAALITPGKRAITVRVNDVIGVAGFTLPGNYVDVIVNTETEKGHEPGRSTSKIVLEHILVLAVAQEASREETKPKVVNAVTLEVTPEQAEELDLARSVGSLTLVLRNQIDNAVISTPGVTKKNLFGAQEQQVEAAAPPPQVQVAKKAAPRPRTRKPVAREHVEIIKGTERSSESF